MTPKLTGLDKVRIAERARRSISSVERAYNEKARVNQYTWEAIAEAARELDLPLPPAPKREAA